MANQGITDPNILAIMAKLNQTEQAIQGHQESEKKKAKENRPPQTFEEFLKAEKIASESSTSNLLNESRVFQYLFPIYDKILTEYYSYCYH